jgi:hypothetical protein
MKNPRLSLCRFAAVIAIAASLASCSSSTSPSSSNNNNNNNNGGGGGTGPTVGSVFHYLVIGEDTNGVPTGQQTTETITVTNIVPGFQGKTNAYLETASVQASDGGEYAFETNGDISEFVQLVGDSYTGFSVTKWLTYPFGSHTTQTFTIDTTLADALLKSTDTIQYHATMTYIGTGTDQVNGVTVPVQIVKFVEHAYSATFTVRTDDISITYDYAPSLKQFTRIVNSQKSIDSFQGPSSGALDYKLASYTLK